MTKDEEAEIEEHLNLYGCSFKMISIDEKGYITTKILSPEDIILIPKKDDKK